MVLILFISIFFPKCISDTVRVGCDQPVQYPKFFLSLQCNQSQFGDTYQLDHEKV